MRCHFGLRIALMGGSISVALCAVSTTAQGQVNGLFGAKVLTGADPSTLVTTNTYNGTTGVATISDTAATNSASDRYDFLASVNGGTSAATFPITQSFVISADVKLTAGQLSPRKEAGIRINGTGGGAGNDGLFLVNTDAGEIVAFGGNAPFALFGNNQAPPNNTNNTNSNGHPFTNGDVVHMGETYNASAHTLVYSAQDITAGGALYTSGPTVTYTPVSPFQFGFYSQWTPSATNTAQDSDLAQFTNISIALPEPASLSVLAFAGIGLLGRRRAKRVV